MIGDNLFNRDFSCKVGSAEISIQTSDLLTGAITPALRASFKVEKSDSKEPNKATVEIYNLNKANRSILKEGTDLIAKAIAVAKKTKSTPTWEWPLIIEAGYVGSRAQIFSGDVKFADSRKDSTDWVTTIEAEDGGNQLANARISKSLGRGSTMFQVLSTLARELGVGLGNSLLTFATQTAGLKIYKKGVVLNGKVSDLLDRYCTTAGFRWCVMDGQLQVLKKDGSLLESVIVLQSSSGLIGSPELGEDGAIKCTALIQSGLKPGKKISVVSEKVKGFFRIERVTFEGDTAGENWYAQVEAKPDIGIV